MKQNRITSDGTKADSEPKPKLTTSSQHSSKPHVVGSTVDLITDAQYKEAFDNLYDYEKEITDHNDKVLKTFGGDAHKDFQDLIDSCSVVGKIEFAEAPKGDAQNESNGIFKDVHVDQYSVGDSGDSYAGFIYANINGKWVSINYEC